MWVGGSVPVRFVLSKSIGSTTIYGPLAAPIAFLIWLYIISVAVLIGAALNSSIDEVFPSSPESTTKRPTPNENPPRRRRCARRLLAFVAVAREIPIIGLHSHILRNDLIRSWRLRSVDPVRIAREAQTLDLTARRFVDLGRTKSMMCHCCAA
jgi:hypothetical protein